MKKLFCLLTLLITTTLLAKINVAVSIAPELVFLKAIGGDKVNPTLMVTPGNSPHTYEPKPSQMIELEKANLYFLIGVEFEEAWMDKFISQNKNMKIIDITEGIEKLPIQAHEEHNAKQEEHHDEGLDPHVWTSPENIKAIVSNIYQALSEYDSSNEPYYKKNFVTFLKKIDTINDKIVTIFKDTPKGSKFMVFHPSWGYFAKQYDLQQIAIEVSGKEPKPKELMKIIEEAKEEKINALFTQPEFSEKSATIIAKELKVPVIKVSPLAQDWDEQLVKIAQSIANK